MKKIRAIKLVLVADVVYVQKLPVTMSAEAQKRYYYIQ